MQNHGVSSGITEEGSKRRFKDRSVRQVGGFRGRFGGRSNAVLSACCACLACCVLPKALNGEISISMPHNISATALNPCWTGGGFLALDMAEGIGVIVGKVTERDVGWEDSRMERNDAGANGMLVG